MEEQIPKGKSGYTWEGRKGSGNRDGGLKEDLFALYGKENAFMYHLWNKYFLNNYIVSYTKCLSREIMITVRL